ncbi:hypothetical protein SLS55_001795 [Diplodia seriata]|uniref:Uncharacterized protein n=1 Tax=Diplodia seriata TaxID=420778 RepID=A0ABR3CSZ6_9PEZI
MTTQGLTKRSDKINQYSAEKMYKQNITNPFGFWSSPAYLFDYAKHGELTKLEYTIDEVKDFIYHHPMSKTDTLVTVNSKMDPCTNGLVRSIPSNLMSLPRELRDKIYDFTTKPSCTRNARHSPLPLPVTCFINKQMRSEALSHHLAEVRWEFDTRKAPYGKGQMGLFQAWLAALGDDARHLARFKLICRLKMYRWEVYISLVADGEPNGARNVDVDERDGRGLWTGAAGIVTVEREGRTRYQAMFPGYRPVVWRMPDPESNGSTSNAKNLQEEINEYIEEATIKPLAQKRWDGALTGEHISDAIEGLLAHEWRCC